MKLLVVGSCGFEHALLLKLLETQKMEKVFVAPGGMTV